MWNKKADMNAIIVMIVMIFAVSFLFLITNFIQYKVNTAIYNNVDSTIGMSNTTRAVYQKVDSTRNMLDYFLMAIFFSLVLGVLIASYYTRNPAIMLAGFILLLVVAIVFAWLAKGIYGELYAKFCDPTDFSTCGMTMIHQIMLKLPLYTLIVGVISGILMFGIPKNTGDY